MKFHFDPTCMLEPSIYRFVMYSNARLDLKKRKEKVHQKALFYVFVSSFTHISRYIRQILSAHIKGGKMMSRVEEKREKLVDVKVRTAIQNS